MDKYNKHGFFTALVLEIRASLYSTPFLQANLDHFLSEFPPPFPRPPPHSRQNRLGNWSAFFLDPQLGLVAA